MNFTEARFPWSQLIYIIEAHLNWSQTIRVVIKFSLEFINHCIRTIMNFELSNYGLESQLNCTLNSQPWLSIYSLLIFLKNSCEWDYYIRGFLIYKLIILIYRVIFIVDFFKVILLSWIFFEILLFGWNFTLYIFLGFIITVILFLNVFEFPSYSDETFWNLIINRGDCDEIFPNLTMNGKRRWKSIIWNQCFIWK